MRGPRTILAVAAALAKLPDQNTRTKSLAPTRGAALANVASPAPALGGQLLLAQDKE